MKQKKKNDVAVLLDYAGNRRGLLRFAGPRMLFYHPVAAVRHLIETKKEKGKIK